MTEEAKREAPTDPRDEARPRRLPVVCRKLRTKTSFASMVGPTDWREGESTTAVYWCLKTMETWGPDDGYADAHRCRQGRACYAAPDGEEIA